MSKLANNVCETIHRLNEYSTPLPILKLFFFKPRASKSLNPNKPQKGNSTTSTESSSRNGQSQFSSNYLEEKISPHMVCARPTTIICEAISRETRKNLSFKIVGNAWKTLYKEIRNNGRESG
jgi:hypothetical protein